MSTGHSIWLLLILLLCGFLLLRPREQEMRVEQALVSTPAAESIERICMPPKFYLPCKGAYCHAPPVPETFA